MGHCDLGMINVRTMHDPVKIGNGLKLYATKIGDKKMTAMHEDGTREDILLKDYKYALKLCVNLFSITQALKNYWSISNKGTMVKLQKDNKTIKFDKTYPTGKGIIVGIELIPRQKHSITLVALPALERGRNIINKDIHSLIGHYGRDITSDMAKYYGWNMQG